VLTFLCGVTANRIFASGGVGNETSGTCTSMRRLRARFITWVAAK
jgi:hypothetical protein